jgi:hypothetical protein
MTDSKPNKAFDQNDSSTWTDDIVFFVYPDPDFGFDITVYETKQIFETDEPNIKGSLAIYGLPLLKEIVRKHPFTNYDPNTEPAYEALYNFATDMLGEEEINPELKPAQTKIEIEISQEDAELIKEFLELRGQSERSSHGNLTLETLTKMLLEDVALAVRRPGSWEGSNMNQVLNSHGY